MADNDPILRIEYEARNAQTHADIGKLDAKMDTLTAQFATLSISMNSKIDTLTTTQANMRANGWKYVATSCISVIVGSGTTIIVQVLLNHILH